MNEQHLLFHDFTLNLKEISKIGDPLEKLNRAIDWKIFRRVIKKMRRNQSGKGGRPAFDEIMMFKALILQQMYNLSDDQLEFQIRDRLSFMRFLGIPTLADIPDAKTIWLFRDKIRSADMTRKLFDIFEQQLQLNGFVAKRGHVIDATIIEAPVQRNSRDENAEIKSGTTPAEWKDNPAKLCQKDIDARWLKKNGERYFGYKNHVVADVDNKFIRDYAVSPASLHDSQAAPALLKKLPSNSKWYGDSAYHSKPISKASARRNLKAIVCRKGTRNHDLTVADLAFNKRVSRIRCRIEHVFGRMAQMGETFVRSIGIERAWVNIGLQNLVYNLQRYASVAG